MIIRNKISAFLASPRELFSILLLFATMVFAQEEVKDVFKPSDDLKQIVGLTERYGMTPRLKKVHKLSKMLSEEEISYLWDFLNKKHTNDPLDEHSLNPIKNDVAVALLEQEAIVEEYGSKMMEMFNAKDKSGAFRHDIVWRDYCIQFLGQWFAVCFNEGEKLKVIDFIYGSIDSNKGTSIPGSALIAINLNKSQLTAEQKLRLLKTAINVASKPEYGELARMSAFHIAAEHSTRFKSTQPEVIKMLKSCINSKCGACLKMSAIAALGTVGVVDDEVEAIIVKYCKSYDIRLRKAAYGAKKKLKL